jgi:uncharacterized membrane protein
MNTEVYANPNQSYMLNDDENNNQKVKYNSSIKKSSYSVLYMITHLIISLFAIYLSWRCNNGFNLLSFLVALFCPYLYIIYALAAHGGCNVFDDIKPPSKVE